MLAALLVLEVLVAAVLAVQVAQFLPDFHTQDYDVTNQINCGATL
jgi:hypothetical protein